MDIAPSHPHLTVIGCAAGMPRPGWPSSGYLLHTVAGALLLDCGPGTAGVAAHADLIGVAISHLHLDHCLDVLVLGKALAASGVDGRLPLHLPEGGYDALRRANRLFPLGPEGPGDHPTDDVLERIFEVRTYRADEPFAVGPAVVTPIAVRHRQPCCGFAVELSAGGRRHRVAYTGDTGDTPAIEVLAADADLLVCEATLDAPDTTDHGHLSAAEAGRRAAAAGAGRLLLTHFARTDDDWLEGQRRAARATFPRPVDLARPGSTHALLPD